MMSKYLLLFLFLAFNISGIPIIDLDSQINYVNVGVLGFSFGVLSLLIKRKMVVTPTLVRFNIAFFVLYLYILVNSLFSNTFSEASLWILLLLRDYIIFISVYAAVSTKLISKTFFAIAYFIVAVAVNSIGFLMYLPYYNDIASVKANPIPGLIYRGGEGFFPHLQSFSTNPIYLTVILLIAIAYAQSHFKMNSLVKYLLTILLIIFVLFTFSRGAILILGVLMLYNLLRPRFDSQGASGSRTSALLTFFLLGLVIVIFSVTPIGLGVQERLAYRFENANALSRYDNAWQYLVISISEHPIIGNGFRSADIRLGGVPVENTYLELVHDLGILGLITFLVNIAICFIRVQSGKIIIFNSSLLIILLLSFSYIGLFLNPITWILMGYSLAIIDEEERNE